MDKLDRVLSLDQFRGYCVAGMFVVNFLGHFEVTHQLLKHNNTHFSLADSIMPSFVLICGYSYRLTFIKRTNSLATGTSEVRKRYLMRSLGLILLSLMLFGFGSQIDSYSQLSLSRMVGLLGILLKANLWEVLAIIGACQIILLPLMNASMKTRILALVVLAATHTLLCWWFNWAFVYGLPNALDEWLGTSRKRAWDGGVFGLLSWSEIMLIGTLLPDLTASGTKQPLVNKLWKLGVGLMMLGYLASCLTRLYDIQPPVSTTYGSTGQSLTSEGTELVAASSPASFSPVLPDWTRLVGRDWSSLFAEPPLVPAPAKDTREPNYWAMDKRIVSQSFVFFSAGFAVVVYSLFVRLSDVSQIEIGPLTIFGQNPLAAYIIHHFVSHSLSAFFPRDSAALWATLGMLLSMWITYFFVNFLSKRNLFLRL